MTSLSEKDWDNRDQIYPPGWNKSKLAKIYEAIVFKTLGDRQQKTVILEMGNK